MQTQAIPHRTTPWLSPGLCLLGVLAAAGSTANADLRTVLLWIAFILLGAAYLTSRKRGAHSASLGTPRRTRIVRTALGGLAALVVLFILFAAPLAAYLGTEAIIKHSDFKVEGLNERGAPAEVAQAIRDVPGVVSVEVDPHSGEAVVGTDSMRPVPPDEIVAALARAGYQAAFDPKIRAAIVCGPACHSLPEIREFLARPSVATHAPVDAAEAEAADQEPPAAR